MRIERHPKLNIWVREDGCIYLPQSAKRPSRWTFGSNSNGYRIVNIGGKCYRIHRLVAEAFLQFPIPEGYQVDHVNRDKSANFLSNLRIVTPSQNSRNTLAHDRVDARGGTHAYEDAQQYRRENSAHYRARHPEKVHEYNTHYYAENKDSIREQRARHYAENKDKIRAKERERSAHRYQARRKTHRQVLFPDGIKRWVPHDEAILLLAIPVKERHL